MSSGRKGDFDKGWKYFFGGLNGLFERNSAFSILVIFSVFFSLALFFLSTGITPNHDAIEWAGASHYFYSSLANGVMPYWNPYSQCGTPFYPYFQSFGLLEPTNLFFVLFYKLTGCTTLTAYLLHYLCYYFVFIVGTYFLLLFIVKSRKVSLLFSLVLLMACFPVFMRQNGALNVIFMVPLMTLFLLLFLREEVSGFRKGFYFFVASFLFAVSSHVFLPSVTILYGVVLLAACFCFRYAAAKRAISFFLSRDGFAWGLLSCAVAALICAPIVALWLDASFQNELFPTLRFLQKNGFYLVRGYASDVTGQLISGAFSNHLKTSLTLLNGMGLIFEPVAWTGIPGATSSEIRLYMGLLPLACVLVAWFKTRDRVARIFSVLALTIFLLSCNFKSSPVTTPSLFQEILCYFFPFLGGIEVYQNFGSLFLFCLIVVAAIGFSQLLRMKSRVFLAVVLLGVCVKLGYAVFPYLIHHGVPAAVHYFQRADLVPWFNFGEMSREFQLRSEKIAAALFSFKPVLSLIKKHFFCLAIIIFLAVGNPFCLRIFRRFTAAAAPLRPFYAPLFDWLSARVFSPVRIWVSSVWKGLSYRRLLWLSLIVLFLDLGLFNAYYVIKARFALYKTYHRTLQEEDCLRTKTEPGFLNYRIPFSFPSRYFTSFFGHEIYHAQKAALPLVVRNCKIDRYRKYMLEAVQGSAESASRGDHFFMTDCYYDYLVNVALPAQPSLSSITSPILNFFPKSAAVFLKDKYEVVEELNESDPFRLKRTIFIEKEPDRIRASVSPGAFFNPANYIKYKIPVLKRFEANLSPRSRENPDAGIRVVDYNANRLRVSVDAPYEGYFYFGDGYSKHWKAAVDGVPAKIEKTNLNFKSVRVAPGKHEVVFSYDPVVFRVALWLYFIGLITGTGIIVLFFHRIRRARS